MEVRDELEHGTFVHDTSRHPLGYLDFVVPAKVALLTPYLLHGIQRPHACVEREKEKGGGEREGDLNTYTHAYRTSPENKWLFSEILQLLYSSYTIHGKKSIHCKKAPENITSSRSN